MVTLHHIPTDLGLVMGLCFNNKSLIMAAFTAVLLPGFAAASSCIGNWPMLCADDDVFLLGQAEIQGRVDASAIGLGTDEPFRLDLTAWDVGQGTITGETVWASLEMDQSGNTVADYGLNSLYEGVPDNAATPAGDRFGGVAALLPDPDGFGKIINDFSLSFLRLNITALTGALWSADGSAALQVTDFKAEFGFLGLSRDPEDPQYYDIDVDQRVILTADSFDLLRFTWSDGAGNEQTRDLTLAGQVAPVPLPASGLLLGFGLARMAIWRRRALPKVATQRRVRNDLLTQP